MQESGIGRFEDGVHCGVHFALGAHRLNPEHYGKNAWRRRGFWQYLA
jgi:hypothetical protein